MTEILMPSLSDSMEQGLILQWLVADGASIEVGQELCEIETDKATMTYESEVAGVLAIVAAEGTTVAVGDPIATVGALADAPPEPAPSASPEPSGTPEPAGAPEPAAIVGAFSRHALEKSPDVAVGAGAAATVGAFSGNAVEKAPRVNGNGHVATGAVAATPLARRLATDHGVTLAELSGSGPRGRIVKADVLAAAGIEVPPAPRPVSSVSPPTAPAPPAAPAASPAPAKPAPAASTKPAPATRAETGNSTEELSRLQQVIARRMSEAKATIPHFQVQTEVAFDEAIALRAQLKAIAGADAPVPSLNDLIVKASALALRRHPHANGSYKDGHFELHARVNVGVAVAADSALVVPTVFDADTKSLGAIAADTRALAGKVRENTITPPELSGATFTVSNLGMFGMTAITPVINPPQAAILGVGAARPTLIRDAETGEIVDRSLLTLTLSCDHRILYGADAARFLAEIKALLEAPLRLAF